jgi:anti-sigma regulatory factor (Ser/Thr protein kinase)
MEDLSLHVLDVAENSIRASAKLVEIRVTEDEGADLLTVEILDDGSGMSEGVAAKVADPFFTTKTVRRVGLGIPFLAQSAREADGTLSVKSKQGGGTRIVATFRHGHPDRKPLGDLGETMAVLVCAHPSVEFVCEHVRNGQTVYRIDTRRAAQSKMEEREE